MSTTQTKMHSFAVEQVINTHLSKFLPPCEYNKISKAMTKVFATKQPEYLRYTMGQFRFYVLLERLSCGEVLAAHEVVDDPNRRRELKKKLRVASGNFHRQCGEKLFG